MRITLALALAASLLVFAGRTCGQTYVIDAFTVAGGGGTSTGGVYSISGTVGQPDASAAPMTNGNFSLTGGFWSIFALQTPVAPLLSVEWQGADVRVFWPLPATDFVLDQSLTATGAWAQVSFPYATNANTISISVPTPTGNKFYRLRKP